MSADTTQGERGSGSILAVAIIATILAVVAMLVPVSIVLGAKQKAAGAADAAALSAADVAVGIIPGAPCAVAESVAGANGAALTACQVDGVIVTVQVVIAAGGFHVASSATAGPPRAETN